MLNISLALTFMYLTSINGLLPCIGIICHVYQTQFHLPDTPQGQKWNIY